MIRYLDEYIYVPENKSLNLNMISPVQKKGILASFLQADFISGKFAYYVMCHQLTHVWS